MRLVDIFLHSGYPYASKPIVAPGQAPTALELWERSFPDEYLLPKAVLSSGADRQPKTWATLTDEEIDDYMRRVSHASLRFAETCPMASGPESGVVDQSLRAHGFSNLWIADTSLLGEQSDGIIL
ncbi:hypothetical protein F4778DRAFT_777997 [Xylariomycetidae sp. FL2044]|nr:hypothetical protein F4778DRAFT_777997 [Xylariomycetidae sp. FL2044]